MDRKLVKKMGIFIMAVLFLASLFTFVDSITQDEVCIEMSVSDSAIRGVSQQFTYTSRASESYSGTAETFMDILTRGSSKTGLGYLLLLLYVISSVHGFRQITATSLKNRIIAVSFIHNSDGKK